MAVSNKPWVELLGLCQRSTSGALNRLAFRLARLTSERLKPVPARVDPSGNRGKFGPPIRHFILWKLQRLYGVRLGARREKRASAEGSPR